jgi:hypothetical protein
MRWERRPAAIIVVRIIIRSRPSRIDAAIRAIDISRQRA